MANPTFDAATSLGASGTGSTTYAPTHTPVSSTNLSAWLWAVSTGTNVSAPTYGGDAMTQVGTSTGTVAAIGTATLWVKAGCKTGAQTCSMTKVSGDNVYVVIFTYKDTNQTTQSDVVGATKSTLSASSIAPSLTTITDNSVTVVAMANSGASATAGTGTQVQSAFNATSGNALLDSTAVVHPAGSSTLNVSDGSCNWAYIMTTVLPIATATVNSNFLMFM